jgi:hypothetical protein
MECLNWQRSNVNPNPTTQTTERFHYGRPYTTSRHSPSLPMPRLSRRQSWEQSFLAVMSRKPRNIIDFNLHHTLAQNSTLNPVKMVKPITGVRLTTCKLILRELGALYTPSRLVRARLLARPRDFCWEALVSWTRSDALEEAWTEKRAFD